MNTRKYFVPHVCKLKQKKNSKPSRNTDQINGEIGETLVGYTRKKSTESLKTFSKILVCLKRL